MAHEVFISYSAEDKVYGDAVCATLEARRVRCWISPRDVMPGVDYGKAIVDAISGSRLMVLVFSSHSNASPHIRREAELAVSGGIPILPLRVADAAPSESLKYYLAGQHWLDALTPPLEAHLEKLGEAVRYLLSMDDGPRLGEWSPAHMSEEGVELRLDATGKITHAGDVVVELDYSGGANGLHIDCLALLAEGREISADDHDGWTGAVSAGNVYHLQLSDFSPRAKYEIVAKVRSDGGTDSYGDIWLVQPD